MHFTRARTKEIHFMHSKLMYYPTTHPITLVYCTTRLSTLSHSHLSAHWISAPREIDHPWAPTYLIPSWHQTISPWAPTSLRSLDNISLSTNLPEGARQFLPEHPTYLRAPDQLVSMSFATLMMGRFRSKHPVMSIPRSGGNRTTSATIPPRIQHTNSTAEHKQHCNTWTAL